MIKKGCSCRSDALQNLVGQQNARYGIIKIFNALQETRANRHLLYVSRPALTLLLFIYISGFHSVSADALISAFWKHTFGFKTENKPVKLYSQFIWRRDEDWACLLSVFAHNSSVHVTRRKLILCWIVLTFSASQTTFLFY